MQIETTGYFKRLVVVGRKKMALCFVTTDGDGYDAETLEELLKSEGINLSDLGDKTVTISISTDCA